MNHTKNKKYQSPTITVSAVIHEETIAVGSVLSIGNEIHVEWIENPLDSRDNEWYDENIGF